MIIKQILVNNKWVDGNATLDGQIRRDKIDLGGGKIGYNETVFYTNEKADLERVWRNSELERTDKFIVIIDYPTSLIGYREALRQYPQELDFPNGTRPTQ